MFLESKTVIRENGQIEVCLPKVPICRFFEILFEKVKISCFIW